MSNHGKAPSLKRPRRLGFLPHWRKMTWVMNTWIVVFAAWIIGGIATRDTSNDCGGGVSAHDCQVAGNVGTGIGVALVAVLGIVGVVVLFIPWVMTRYSRTCPQCGSGVKRGALTCINRNCHYDFTVYGNPQQQGFQQPYPPAV
jgi:lysylphosphatidylglycerol synthetase-like protein (DUF2156 family)